MMYYGILGYIGVYWGILIGTFVVAVTDEKFETVKFHYVSAHHLGI